MTLQSKVDETCNQPAETGLCQAYFRKFTYDAANKTCSEFIYGGCGGNSNRFDSLEDCQAKCKINRLNAGAQPLPTDHIDMQGQVRNDICYLPKETGPCRGFFRRFAYNDVTQSCEEFVYGGCGGNANRFDTMVDCETQCYTNDEEDACGLPLVTGPCRGAFQKYGYDTVSKACKEFMYGGCRGNGNRFDTMGLCENRCEPTQNCDVVSCIIPIIAVVAIVVIAIIIAVVLIKKRRRSSNKKYAPAVGDEPEDASELKKVSPDAEDV